ncbi:hypothetical protein FB45DRAFT_1057681 [Roridomyces roridus]|uniref:Uncharacterized protein n=1 Tax=Roridomyces roridus TaxID=1738132 RepID=A0AAD7BWF9_9AGAR|nr:hypothetical protein FB45DRAFT_1057681 [Roridomyces roridus]
MESQKDLEQQLISTLAQYHISPESTHIQLMGLSPTERITLLQQMVQRVTSAKIIGVKPTSSQRQPETYEIPIPNDKLSIRLFPGNTAPDFQPMFFLDFVHKDTFRPVNAPATYKLSVVGPGCEVTMYSVEVACQVKPGPCQEKFLVLDGLRCRLRRPGRLAYDFDIPRRFSPPRAPEPGVGQAILIVQDDE